MSISQQEDSDEVISNTPLCPVCRKSLQFKAHPIRVDGFEREANDQVVMILCSLCNAMLGVTRQNMEVELDKLKCPACNASSRPKARSIEVAEFNEDSADQLMAILCPECNTVLGVTEMKPRQRFNAKH